MTSDQDTKVVAEPQVQHVQEAKENAHLVSLHCVFSLSSRSSCCCCYLSLRKHVTFLLHGIDQSLQFKLVLS
uniref:Uncharacterized protein n=1 Tax=Periophthalmus magnuspinnatus TaxID=409849 RepID=A0A3B4AS05_9GOBI